LVCIDGKNSSLACVNHGVPQGSILGPLFFILFINDLPLYITAQTDLYADDTTIACSADYKFMHKLERELNNSVAEILNWAVTNKLPINVEEHVSNGREWSQILSRKEPFPLRTWNDLTH